MALDKVQVGSMQVSRLAIGGNPFSGFSHQGEKRDTEMRRYYTVARIKETLRRAEAAGINTFFGRVDNHVIRTLQEYWDEGGTIQWFAQTASKCEDYIRNIKTAAANGAKGCYLHGGQVDYYWHRHETGHFRKALDPDFQLTCYYNPQPPHRQAQPREVRPRPPRPHGPHDLHAQEQRRPLQSPRRRPHPRRRGLPVRRQGHPPQGCNPGFHLGDDPDLITKTAALFERIVQPAARAK